MTFVSEKEYILEDWPEDYEFYDHNKGHVLNPRHDMYLHGKYYRDRVKLS
jgi:hypothetical protein